MKKNMYIQPAIEVVKLQQSQSICVSPGIGGDLGGGEDSENPLDL